MLHIATLALHSRHPHPEEAEEKAAEQVLQLSNTTSVKSDSSRKESKDCCSLIDFDDKVMETVLQ